MAKVRAEDARRHPVEKDTITKMGKGLEKSNQTPKADTR